MIKILNQLIQFRELLSLFLKKANKNKKDSSLLCFINFFLIKQMNIEILIF